MTDHLMEAMNHLAAASDALRRVGQEDDALIGEVDPVRDEIGLLIESLEELRQQSMEATLTPNRRWSRKYINSLPDSHFFYVDKECVEYKDAQGRSHPLTCRHLPYVDKQGYIDPDHVRNAISRAPQAYIPKAEQKKVQDKARRILREIEGA